MRVVVITGSTSRASATMAVLFAALLAILLARGSDSQRLGMTRPLPHPLPPPEQRPLCVSQFSLVNYACSLLPYNPGPYTPEPPSPPDDGDSHELHHHHRHHHHHHHHHHPHGYRDPGPAGEDCCRWLEEVDETCVCDLLVHLPAFLARPLHEYRVIVPDVCNVTYSCDGRLRP